MNRTGGLLNNALSRRSVLKGGAAIAGARPSPASRWSGRRTQGRHPHTPGCPIRHFPTSPGRPGQDLGFKVEMSVVDHPGLTNRMVNDPASSTSQTWKSGRPRSPFRRASPRPSRSKDQALGQMTPLYTEGVFAGKEVSRQAIRRYEFMYRERRIPRPSMPGRPTGRLLPGVYNADTLGIRPDLVGRTITSSGDLSPPDFKGKTAIQNIPTIGIMDAIMAMEAAGVRKYGDKGNPTSGRALRDHRKADRIEEGRLFPGACGTGSTKR